MNEEEKEGRRREEWLKLARVLEKAEDVNGDLRTLVWIVFGLVIALISLLAMPFVETYLDAFYAFLIFASSLFCTWVYALLGAPEGIVTLLRTQWALIPLRRKMWKIYRHGYQWGLANEKRDYEYYMELKHRPKPGTHEVDARLEAFAKNNADAEESLSEYGIRQER